MCEDCGTDWPDQDAEEIARLKARVEEMAKRIASLEADIYAMVPWEPRRDVPTAEQATAWYYAGHYWMVATVERDDPFITRDAPTAGNLIEWCLPWRSGFPVSWADVDAAMIVSNNNGENTHG
jgi:hypothetical protein